MPRYRTKPIEIQTIQWTGNNPKTMFKFLGSSYAKVSSECLWVDEKNFYMDYSKVVGGLIIKTLAGERIAQIDDWIIKDTRGGYYPCKPDMFEMMYEAW